MLPVIHPFRIVVPAAWIALSLLSAVSPARAQRPAEDAGILQYLESTIAWYRDVGVATGSLTTSRESMFVDNARDSSTQAVRAAFQFARAAAAIPSAKPQGGATPDSSRSRNLVQAEATMDQRTAKLQTRISELDREIQNASPRRRATLVAAREKLQGDLNVSTARRGSLRSLIGLLNGADTGLSGKIDDLEQSVPETLNTKAPQTRAAAGPTPGFRPDSAGIVSLASGVFSLTQTLGRLNRLIAAADELRQANDNLRVPLRSALREVIRRSDEIAAMPETGDPAELTAARKELDSLLARFKLLSAVSGPLGQSASAIRATRGSLTEWHDAVNTEYRNALRYLLLRLGMLAIAVLVIFLLSEVWRRATIRYIQDLRRRRQILLVRRIVVGCTIALFVVLSFVTEFGSIATFAGFSAAGIAVAMQSVILSVVAYFFLVGRWGVRVGDRVTVSGVTGDVIDIGLFRLYLMEVAGSGLDRHPTGRVVVFPNAVFFQPSALYKQMPGVDYTWCTVSLALAEDSDYSIVESRLMAAVETVYADYREPIERQYRTAQTSLNLHTEAPRPEARIRFADNHLEFAVHYPVEVRRAGEFEDRVTRELLSAIDKEPRLRLAAGAAPKFRMAAPDAGK